MGREVKRVALDFNWPINKVWEGFLNPYGTTAQKCHDCAGTGYGKVAKHLYDQWYGYVPFDPTSTGSKPFTPESPAVRAFAERNVYRSPEYYGYGEAVIRKEAKRLCTLFNDQWFHHLDADDVKVLVEAGRLTDFIPWRKQEEIAEAAYYAWEARVQSGETGDEISDWYTGLKNLRGPYPTPEQVNEWSIGGFGHDSINAWIVVKAKAERLGHSATCPTCQGGGTLWPDAEDKALFDAWTPQEPPAGEGWQFWENVTEGSPQSPVFATADALVNFLVNEQGYSFKGAEAFVKTGWAMSMVLDGDGQIYNDVESAVLFQEN